MQYCVLYTVYCALTIHYNTLQVGVIPTAVSWLFKAIKERRHGAGAARVSVRVSAAEIRTGAGGAEEMRDLLGDSGQCSSHL